MGPAPDAAPLSWYGDVRRRRPRARRWRPAIRREHLLDALACLAVAALCFSQAGSETLFRMDRDFYNRVPLGVPTLLAVLLNVLAVATAGFAIVRIVRIARPRVWRRLAAVTGMAALVAGFAYLRLTYETVRDATQVIERPVTLVPIGLVLLAALVWPERALRGTRRLALVAAPAGVLTLLHTLWMFLELAAGPVWRLPEPAPLKTAAPSLRRVVWVVFEELDQRVTFEDRPAGLELPEFDRLRRESLYADAARPPAARTEISMPALITGRPVVAVEPLSPNDLELTFVDGKTARWSTLASVFSAARVLGYDTALIGWHLPYPRVLGRALGVADWRPSAEYEQTRGDTVGQALLNQWASLVPPLHLRRLSARRFEELADLAMRTATDGRFGVVLLHLPLPRPPGIYDRSTGRLTTWNRAGAEAESLDNLALADRILGELRRGLSRARLGDRTWLVVSSTRWGEGSTRDDGAADHRVPFLVRPPDGGRAAHMDGAFNTLATHNLVLALLRGSVADTSDTVTWLTRNPSRPPRDYTSHGRPIY